MSHILQLILWGRYAAEGGVGYHGISAIQYNDWHWYSCGGWEVSGEIGKFGKAMEVAELGEMDNSGMVQTIQ